MNSMNLWSMRNGAVLKSAVETINSFLKDKSCKLYLFDGDGNIFEPKGKIEYALLQFTKAE